MNCDNLPQRKALFDALGGVPETAVRNIEWAYMLQEETRNSLAIEGVIATEQELKAVLQGRKTTQEILNYYRTAQNIYDLALQDYREGETHLSVSLVRHVHSELFREQSKNRGEFRQKRIQIQRAKVQPPEFDIPEYVRAWIQLSLDMLASMPFLSALARIHTLFEGIHPFEDGNGRAGRILLNYLSVSKGYLPIIIKGLQQEEKERYYQALELGDKGFHSGFPHPEPEVLRKGLAGGDFHSLENLFCEGLQPNLDKTIIALIERQEPLIEFKSLASQFGVQESTLRQWVHRGKLIAVKRGKKLYSHPKLLLASAVSVDGKNDSPEG
jgi:fido (protein-threonine AMPylation protein)